MTAAEIESALRESSDLTLIITRDIGKFTVALFALYDHKDGEKISLAGTGTLLALGKEHYILTAAHVWEEVLKSASRIGITLIEGMDHRYPIDVKSVEPFALIKPAAWNEWGPDMTLLRVPPEHLPEITAHRVFYDASVDGKSAPPGVDAVETKVVMGTPADFGSYTQNHADILILGLFVNVDAPYEMKGDFDYYDFDVDTTSPNTPEDFRGVSGGGLWSVVVYCSPETGKIDWSRTLEGVAFYQLALKDGHRTIRCHGPKSVGRLCS